jgi:DNA repair protein RecN (Recombination protein N)
VRREITAQGRSRAFINGSLATAVNSRNLPDGSSSSTVNTSITRCSIRDASTVLDTYAQLEPLRAPVGAVFDRMRATVDELARLRAAVAARETRQELLAFQLAELDRAGLKALSQATREKTSSSLRCGRC